MTIRAAALGAVLALCATAASAQDKTFELRLSHWVPPSHPLQKALEDWGASIEKASNGTIKYKVFPSQQLGKAFDHYDMARDGIADVTYVSPGYQPGRFPIIDAGNLPFMVSNAKEGTGALDEWYRKYAEKEMKDVKFCFAFFHDPGSFHSKTKKIIGAGRHQGHEDPPRARHDGDLDHAARRHQRAVLGAGSARHHREGRRRGGDLPVGLDPAVRHRQGHQVPHGSAALRDELRLGDEQGEVRADVGGAEEGDRRSLHHAMGDPRREPVGRLRARRHQEAQGRGPRGLPAHRRAARRVEEIGRAGGHRLGRRREEGRRRSRRRS